MDNYISYEYNNGTIKLKRYEEHPILNFGAQLLKLKVTNGILILPSSVDGCLITEIDDFIFMPMGEGFLDSIVEILIIPNCYQRLGKKNFSQWHKLKKVYINSPATSLCAFDFAYCENLTEVVCGNKELLNKCKALGMSYDSDSYGCFDRIHTNINFSLGDHFLIEQLARSYSN